MGRFANDTLCTKENIDVSFLFVLPDKGQQRPIEKPWSAQKKTKHFLKPLAVLKKKNEKEKVCINSSLIRTKPSLGENINNWIAENKRVT